MTLASRYRSSVQSHAAFSRYKIYGRHRYTVPRKSPWTIIRYNRDNEIVGVTRHVRALTGKDPSNAISPTRLGASSVNFNEMDSTRDIAARLIFAPSFIIPDCRSRLRAKDRNKAKETLSARDGIRLARFLSRENLMSDRRWFTGIRRRAGISQISGLMAPPWRTHPFAKNRPAVKSASSAELAREESAWRAYLESPLAFNVKCDFIWSSYRNTYSYIFIYLIFLQSLENLLKTVIVVNAVVLNFYDVGNEKCYFALIFLRDMSTDQWWTARDEGK